MMLLLIISAIIVVASGTLMPIDSCETVKCDTGKQCVNGKCMCGENMEFEECGSACPAQCGVTPPVACNKMCVSGCFCKQGFILSKDRNTCLSMSDCRWTRSAPAPCALNEDFKECGLAIEPTCDNPNPRFITLRCINNNICQCNDGFLRHSSGSCVLPMHCNL